MTRHQYEKHFKLEFTEQNLMSAEEILRESAASTQADAMLRKYYGSVNLTLKPLLVSGELPVPGENEDAVGAWREARQATEARRAEAEKLSAEYGDQQKRLVTLIAAQSLAKAGFKLEPKAFDLPDDATSPARQEIAARFALDETSAAMSAQLAKLDPFMDALRRRVTIALRLAPAVGVSSGDQADDPVELASLLAAVGAELPRVHQIGSKLSAFVLLAQNRGNHSNPAEVDNVASGLAAELQSLVGGIQERLKEFTYPFPHARGRLTVAEYARSEKPADNDWHRAFLEGDAHVDRLFALHYRLVGRILAHADAAEATLERG